MSAPPERDPAPPSGQASLLSRIWRSCWARRADAAGALLSCVGLLIVFAPVLFGGKTLSSASFTLTSNGFQPFPAQQTVGQNPYRLDVAAGALAFEPWAEVVHDELAAGRLPLWNPHQGAGAPLAANMQSSTFDPLMVAVRLDPNPVTWDLTIIGCFVIGTICAYAFLRVAGSGYLAAVTGATAFSICGYFSLYSNDGFVRAFLYLPLLLLLIEWVVRTRQFLPIPLLGLATFGCIAAGMPEITFFVLLTIGTYGVYRVVWGPRARTRAWSAVALGGGLALGVALAAPLLLIFAEYERISFNVHKGESGVGMRADPGRFLLNWLAPFFNGPPVNATSAPGQMSGTRNWVGGAVAALAVVGLAARTRAAKLLVPFFGLVGLLVLAKAYNLQLLRWVGRLPGFELVDFPTFALPVAGFAIAVLAAAGVDGIRRHELRIVVLVVALGLAGLAGLGLLRANEGTLSLIPADQAVRAIVIAGAMGLAVVVVALAVRPRVAAYVVCAVVLVELVALAPGRFADRADPYVPPGYVKALQHDVDRHPGARVFGLDALLYPNIGSGFGLDDIRMLDALYVDRYFRYAKAFLDPGIYDRFVGTKWGSTESVAAYRDNPMFDLLGARFLVSGFGGAALIPLLGDAGTPGVVDVRQITVGGETRFAIYQYSTSDTPLTLTYPFVGRLHFDYGLDDVALADPRADGADLSVVATRQSGKVETLWSGGYGPDDPEGPGWRSATVDVADSEDPVMSLALVVDGRSSDASDWVGWSSISVEHPDGRTDALAPVDTVGGTTILENGGAMPRSFLVHDAIVVPDLDAAEATFEKASGRFPNGALRVEDVDVGRQAVVEAAPGQLPAALQSGASCTESPADSVRIASYEADEVHLDVEAACPGLLVLTDTYFPGWEATVNGQRATIHPTDMAFRGVVVDKGSSEVVFRYRPPRFRAGLVVAFLAIVATTAAGVITVVRRRRGRSVADAPS